MNHEIVSLTEKRIAGLSTRTSNAAPDMGAKIGGLWQKLYGEGVLATIPSRVGENSYGLYTNYADDANGEYDVIAGFETTEAGALPDALAAATIPAGKYAKFSLVADMTSGGVGEAWNDIWATDLKRAYTVDFEEYLPSEDMSKAPVNIYISLLD